MKKHILPLFLSFLFLLAPVFATAQNEGLLLGDVNGDGGITAADYIMTKRAILRTYTPTELQAERADINRNGRLDAGDYIMLKRHVLRTYVITGSVKNPALPDSYITAKLIDGATDAKSMAFNTAELQRCVDEANAKGGSTVYLPAGTFHFTTQGMNARQFEDYVCMPKDNVTVIGEGENTILKPVGVTKNGLDMFYFNEYADSSFRNPKYLVNADFRDFVIDGELANTRNYTSAGKGFMINLYKDCDFYNIIVKNTDGTGFGMDCPINCTIINCEAYNCGKAATTSNVGASGFGIGTGYCSEESILIDNCYAEGNKKFGVFFEHQGRFTPSAYTAEKLKNILVVNCTAKNNYIDFGGELAVDVTYRNCTVPEGSTAVSWIAFNHYSVRCKVENMHVEAQFDDVSDKNAYYYDAVYWAVNQGLTTGIGGNLFGINASCTKAQALTFLYRLAGMPGELKLSRTAEKVFYENPLKWALQEGITETENGIEAVCTYRDFLNFLWKYAGSPKVSGRYDSATNWALREGLIDDAVSGNLLRCDAVTLLYKYFVKEPEQDAFVVVIDAGHQVKGNYEKEPIGPGASEMKTKVAGGTSGCVSGLQEYELTLTLALKLQTELEQRGYTVKMIRTAHDVDLSNAQRAEIANAAGADAFIRIHANGSEDASVHGAMTICQTENNPYNAALYNESRALSDAVLEAMTAAAGCKKRYVWETDTMSGINWCRVPVTIVEVGYMSNPEEDALLASDTYQNRLAIGIANGIDTYRKAGEGNI